MRHSSILAWIAFVILNEKAGGFKTSPWPGTVLCLLTGALVVFSGHRCRPVQGPRMGNIVRTVILVVMAAVAFWRAGIAPAAVLIAAAVATAAIVMMDPAGPEAAEDSSPTSTKAEDKTGN